MKALRAAWPLLLVALAAGALGWMLAALLQDRDHQGLDSSKLVGRANVISAVVAVVLAVPVLWPVVKRTGAAPPLDAPAEQAGAGTSGSNAAPLPSPARRLGAELGWVLARGAQDLQVHPAIRDGAAVGAPFLTDYARRAHDRELGERIKAVVGGRSTMVVLVGGSSTGKTRACWEALGDLERLSGDWRVWRPTGTEDLLAGLTSSTFDVARTVVWLDELQLYVQTKSPTVDEAVAAALQGLLDDPEREPVLVLGTIWPDRWSALVRQPGQAEEDPRPLARRLLQHRGLPVPEVAEGEDFHALKRAAGQDGRLAVALERDARHPIQYLAGARELLKRYDQATPPLRAVLDAVGDARRVGVPRPFTVEFVERAAQNYLEQRDLLQLPAADRETWVRAALVELQVPSRGVPGPLSPDSTGQGMVLADYLEQHLRRSRALTQPRD